MYNYNYNIATICYVLILILISLISGYSVSDYSHVPFVLSAIFIGASINQYIGHCLKEEDELKKTVKMVCIGFGVYITAVCILMALKFRLSIIGAFIFIAVAAVGIYLFLLTGKSKREMPDNDDFISFTLYLSSLISVPVLFVIGIGILLTLIKDLLLS